MVPAEAVFAWATAAIEVALAGVLLAVNARDRASRAFALYLGVLGVIYGCRGALLAFPEHAAYWARSSVWFGLADDLLLVAFLAVLVFPSRSWRLRGALAAVTATVVAFEAAYAWDHAHFFGGPLEQADLWMYLIPGAAALVVLARASEVEEGRARTSLLLVAFASAFHHGSWSLGALVGFGRGDGILLAVLASLLVLAAAFPAALLVLRARARDPGLRRQLGGLAAAFAAVVLGIGLFALDGSPAPAVRLAVEAATYLTLPLVIVFALLRYRLFDVDLKLRWTISRGTLAGVFLAAFVVASSVAEEFLTETYGLLAGGLTAGALLFAIAPLQRFADRVASAAMPGVRPPSEMAPSERSAVYRAQVRAAWADGTLQASDRRLLDHLRDTLGLSRDEASRIESEVLGSG